MFNPAEIAKTIVLRQLAGGACHLSVVVECVRLSDISRMASGYSAIDALIKTGEIVCNGKDMLSMAIK